MVSVVYASHPCQPHPYGNYGDHAYHSGDHPRNVHRRRINRRGLAEIVGTVILVAIVVAAAAAFSLFVATYQSQLQKEEAATHDRNLEAVRILRVTSPTAFGVDVLLASSDVNPMNLTDYSLNGIDVASWNFTIAGSRVSAQNCQWPASSSCDSLPPLEQAYVNLTSAGMISYPLTLGVLTARSNDFSYAFVPPVAIAKVYFVQTGAGNTTPVFDGSASFQSPEPDNASLVGFNWTIFPQGLSPNGVAYDSTQHEVLVTDARFGQLMVVNDSSDSIVASVTVGDGPAGVAFDPAQDLAFVADSLSHNLSIVDLTTNKVVHNITFNGNSDPTGVVYDPGTGQAFVALSGLNSTAVVSDSTFTVLKYVTVGTDPVGLAYDSLLGLIFVTNSGSANLTAIGSTDTVSVPSIAVWNDPTAIAYDGNTHQMFVANSGSDNVSVINDTSDRAVKNLTVGTSPDGVAYDSHTNQVFVSNSGSGNVSVINDTTDHITNVPAGRQPSGIVFDPAVKGIFVALTGPGGVGLVSDKTDTLSVGNVLRYVAQGEEVEAAYLWPGETYTVDLQVVNTDGFAGSTSIVYKQP